MSCATWTSGMYSLEIITTRACQNVEIHVGVAKKCIGTPVIRGMLGLYAFASLFASGFSVRPDKVFPPESTCGPTLKLKSWTHVPPLWIDSKYPLTFDQHVILVDKKNWRVWTCSSSNPNIYEFKNQNSYFKFANCLQQELVEVDSLWPQLATFRLLNNRQKCGAICAENRECSYQLMRFIIYLHWCSQSMLKI